ncbi:MAG: YigZ family protein [Chloroflexi bacterium]|nr:YigZ family protein [Chloroflexota bacterium]
MSGCAPTAPENSAAMSEPYLIPSAPARAEIIIKRSRFVTTVSLAQTVDQARQAIAAARAEFPKANHHVYAFRVGFDKTVTEGMSDDGEPRGTAGRPTLAVLRGAEIGDIVLVTARFFGGVKLGAGGLVRAYTEAAQVALSELKTERKVERQLLGIEMPYAFYKTARLLISAHGGVIEDENFDAQVMLFARFAVPDVAPFSAAVADRSAGRVEPVILD